MGRCLDPLTVWPTQASRQSASLTFGVCHSALPFVGLARQRGGSGGSSCSGLLVFPLSL